MGQVADKDFTSDWVSGHLPIWTDLAARIQSPRPNVLEIGSWEGRSAIAWLNLLPGSRITCIDAWAQMTFHEARFDRNTAPYAARVRKIIGSSGDALGRLIAERRSFDLIYIDGEHTREGTVRDSVLAWPLLKRGGILLWDDYLWETHLPLKDRPQEAIDWFVANHQHDLAIIHHGYQVAGMRLSDGAGRRRGRKPRRSSMIHFLGRIKRAIFR